MARKTIFPGKGTEDGKTTAPSFKETKAGNTAGPVYLGLPSEGRYPMFDALSKAVDKYLGFIPPFNEARKEKGDKPAPPPPPKNGFSRKDYRDADTLESEFAYADIKRVARERGYNVVEMPDMRMNSIFGNIGYEKDNDIYIAMSKVNTKQGVEVIAHELMAKDLQRKTGRYEHDYFHPVIEWLQGSAAMTYITGRNKPDTMDSYVHTAMEACAA